MKAFVEEKITKVASSVAPYCQQLKNSGQLSVAIDEEVKLTTKRHNLSIEESARYKRILESRAEEGYFNPVSAFRIFYDSKSCTDPKTGPTTLASVGLVFGGFNTF
jgi:hypothetical protein